VVRPFPRPCAKRELHALGCLYFWNSMYWMFYSIVCPALITLIYICICFLLSVWLSHSYAHHFTFVGLFFALCHPYDISQWYRRNFSSKGR
jgi:hypothetical protein